MNDFWRATECEGCSGGWQTKGYILLSALAVEAQLSIEDQMLEQKMENMEECLVGNMGI